MPIRESNLFPNILLLVASALVLLLLSGFSTPLVVGAILASISHPFYQKLVIKVGGRKTLAALLVLLIIILIIILPFFGILTLLTKQAFGLVNQIQDQLNSSHPFAETIDKLSANFNIDLRTIIEEEVIPNISSLGSILSGQLKGLVSNISRLILGFFVLMITIFYLLRDGNLLGNFLKKVSPLKMKDNDRMFTIFRETGQAVFFGNLISGIAQGVLGGLGFLIFGLDAPVFWGAIMAFISFIPLLGPYIISIPATIYLFLVGNPLIAIGFFVYNMLIVSSADNIIKPIFIGDKIKVHPFFILLTVLGGLKLFGIIGIVYGPLIAAIFMALVHTFEENSAAKIQPTNP